MRRTLRLLALALPLAAAACLGDDPVAPIPEIEETEFASSLGVDLTASTKTASGLWYRDITVGTGESLAAGDSVYVTYTGHFTNGSQFTGGKSLFELGKDLIAGVDEGIRGMKVGGRRQLIVPPHLGYGSQWDVYHIIPPNSILVFDMKVDSLKVSDAED